MQRNKALGRRVRQTMTNETRPTKRKSHRLQSGARAAARRRVKHASMPSRYRTFVTAPVSPFQPAALANVKCAQTQATLKRILITAAKRDRPVSIGVHAKSCVWSTMVLPLIVDVDDFEALNECINERDERCTCKPLIMYTGAKA